MNRQERKKYRDIATAAALLGIKNKDSIHYTQNAPARWEGIDKGLLASKGQFPHYADCSAFVTWCLWNALRHGPDVVNHQDWKAGYTGTLVQHGRVINKTKYMVRGDVVLYGTPTYHTAIIIGRHNGQLLVASHGEESGPYIVPWNAWPVNSVRRYITLHPTT